MLPVATIVAGRSLGFLQPLAGDMRVCTWSSRPAKQLVTGLRSHQSLVMFKHCHPLHGIPSLHPDTSGAGEGRRATGTAGSWSGRAGTGRGGSIPRSRPGSVEQGPAWESRDRWARMTRWRHLEQPGPEAWTNIAWEHMLPVTGNTPG